MGGEARRRKTLRRCLRRAGYSGLSSEHAHEKQVAFHGEKSTAEVCEKEPRLIAYGTFNVYEICGKAYIYDHMRKRFVREPSRDHFIGETAAELPTTKFPHLIYVGTIKAMKIVAKRGVKVLNPRTMKYQTVSKTAKYSVVPDPEIHGGATLYSNEDLKRIAEEKDLVWG